MKTNKTTLIVLILLQALCLVSYLANVLPHIMDSDNGGVPYINPFAVMVVSAGIVSIILLKLIKNREELGGRL